MEASVESAMDAVQGAGVSFPRLAIGVVGSAGGVSDPAVRRSAHRIGQEVARRGAVLITGACPGLPQEAVRGAHALGGTVVGISPALNLAEHVHRYHSPAAGYDTIIFTGSGLMGREIDSIRSCDLVVIVGGRSGTLGEFAIAYDEGKVIGVLQGSGGIADKLHHIIDFVQKDTGSVVFYDSDPVALIDRLVAHYEAVLLPRILEIVAGAAPHGVLEA